MPHLTVHVVESDLAGREAELIEGLTGAVVAVYGEWARGSVDVRLIGLPAARWAIGGAPASALAAAPASAPVPAPAPSVTFGVRAAVFQRPDAAEIVARLVAVVTDAVVAVFGERVRAGVTVELVATPAGRSGVGGVIVG